MELYAKEALCFPSCSGSWCSITGTEILRQQCTPRLPSLLALHLEVSVESTCTSLINWKRTILSTLKGGYPVGTPCVWHRSSHRSPFWSVLITSPAFFSNVRHHSLDCGNRQTPWYCFCVGLSGPTDCEIHPTACSNGLFIYSVFLTYWEPGGLGLLSTDLDIQLFCHWLQLQMPA